MSETRDGSPQMINGYRLEELLASGPHSEMYRARETASGTSCVIRIISTNHPNSQQFLHEGKIAAGLFQPHVADMYEAGVLENGDVYVVEEDSQGETLRDYLRSNGVPELLTAIQIIRQASEGLHALHQKGLTHRAVKPENILLSSDTQGRLSVRVQHTDFGGVAQRSIVSNKFLIESQLASLRYFAPEQFEGEAVSPQTDVYSLGVVFYEMLAGRPPFDATKAAALIEMHRDQPPPEVKIDDFNLRMLVTHALTESLQKASSLRQSSANLLARQLRHIEQLSTHVSTPPPAGVAPPEPPRVAPRISVVLDPAVAATTHPYVVAIPVKPSFDESVEDRAKTSELDLDELFGAVFEDHSLVGADSFADLSVPPDAVVQELASHPAEARRSRLKLHRKRLRSAVTSRNEIPRNIPTILPVVEKGTPPVASIITPTMIEWDQPEDDIPSMEDVLEVLSHENVVDLPLLPRKDADIIKPVMSVVVDDVIPKVVWLGEDARPTPVDNWPLQEQLDDQFVTTIDVRRPKNNELDRRPVFFRNNVAIESVYANTGALMFAGYSTPSDGGSLSRHRSHLIAAGLVIVTALTLLASGLLTEYLPSSSDSDRVSANPAPIAVADRGTASAIPASQRKTTKDTREPVKPTETAKTTKTRTPANERPAATRNQNSRKISAVASNDRSSRSNARPAKTPVALMTRPRVVRNY